MRIRVLAAVLPLALAATSQASPVDGSGAIVPIGDTVINVNDDDIIIGEEFEITVKHRAVPRLSSSFRVIKASEFNGKFADLPSVLESVSGVDMRSMGGYGQYAESSIRGGTALGIRVYLDGVPLNGASTGAVDLSKIPLDKITEIRVSKSASGLRQMGAGMGGVIELFTSDDRNDNGITGINVEAGSFGRVGGGAVAKKSVLSKKTGILFRHQINIDISKSDNDYPFVHDNGTVISTLRDPDPTWDDTVMRKSNNYYKSIDAAYGLSADISENHKITQRISAGAYDQGLFAYNYKGDQSGSTGGSTVIYGIDYRGELSKHWTLGAEASGIYRGNALSDPDAHFGLGGAKEITSRGATADFLLDARYSFTENFYAAGLTGARYDGYVRRNRAQSDMAEMSRYEYRAGAEAGLKTKIGESSTTETALRAVYKYATDKSSAGFDYLPSDGKKYGFGYPAAEAAFKMEAGSTAFRLSAAASKRSPTFFERFGWGSGFISNPDLREETRAEADAGISIDMGEYGAAVSVFGGTVDGKIKSIPYGRGFVKAMNFADTKFYGAELDVNSKPLKHVTIELSAAYLKSVIGGAKDPSWKGRIEPFIPEFSGFFKTEIDVWKLNIGHGIKYESACYLNIENIAKRPRQTELSAWALCKINKSISMRYRVDNYLNTANFDFLDNPKPRREHSGGIALSF